VKHLSDTGKQIEADMRAKHPNAQVPSIDHVAKMEEDAEAQLAIGERPVHPIAALGATFLIVAALVVALTFTSLIFLASIIAVPVTILAFTLLGIWAFWSWDRESPQDSSGSGSVST
jgi:hypothetical protein